MKRLVNSLGTVCQHFVVYRHFIGAHSLDSTGMLDISLQILPNGTFLFLKHKFIISSHSRQYTFLVNMFTRKRKETKVTKLSSKSQQQVWPTQQRAMGPWDILPPQRWSLHQNCSHIPTNRPTDCPFAQDFKIQLFLTFYVALSVQTQFSEKTLHIKHYVSITNIYIYVCVFVN